ncbi:MAG TPA: hypothetical protein VIN08_12240 [Ohtaekwangia sp.]|uniref:hypothetical protein n=1 Tax=Ohtaekwangia sp. TaxID=2066019 RepID=UPI002F95B72B
MKQYKIQSGLLDRQRDLIVAPDYIAFDNNELKSAGPTTIYKQDIKDIKLFAEAIRWDLLYVGQKYTLAVKDQHDKVLVIRMKNFFGLRNHCRQTYAEITRLVWEYYLKDIVDQYLIRFYEHNETLTVGNLIIHHDGIALAGSKVNFDWPEIAFKPYTRFWVISAPTKPEHAIHLDRTDWNTAMLSSLIETILQERKGNQNL